MVSKAFLKHLRLNQSEAEKRLWYHLRRKNFFGLKFRRQAKLDKYVVDFICFEKKIIIEVDGGQHNWSINKQKDEQRTKVLESLGFHVVRYWNNEVLNNTDGVLQHLAETLGYDLNNPLP